MNTIKLQQRGTLTLPKTLRDSLDLNEGDVLAISEENNKIILEKTHAQDVQLLADIKNSLNEIKQGKFIEFASIAEFKKKLRKYDAN